MRPGSWCLCSCKSAVLALFIVAKFCSSLTSCLADTFLAPRGGLSFPVPDCEKAGIQGLFSECGLSGIVPIYTRIADCSVFGRKCRCSVFWICSKYVKSFIQKQVPAWNQVQLCYVLELWQKTSQTRFWRLSWDLKGGELASWGVGEVQVAGTVCSKALRWRGAWFPGARRRGGEARE